MARSVLYRAGIGFLGLVCLGGCGGGGITFRCEPPEKPVVVPIQGLGERVEFIEMVDRLDGHCPGGDTVIVIVEEGDQRKAYKTSTGTGQARLLTPVAKPEAGSYYWERVEFHGMGLGEKAGKACALGCFALAGGRVDHTSERFGFSAERRFGCTSPDRVSTSYEYAEKVNYNLAGDVQTTSWDSGFTLKFLVGGSVIEIAEGYGYVHAFTSDKNILRSRFYMTADGHVLGSTPDRPSPCRPATTLFFYDLEKRQSWGAEMPFAPPTAYNDFAVTDAGRTAVFLVGREGELRFLKYDASALALAVKMNRAARI